MPESAARDFVFGTRLDGDLEVGRIYPRQVSRVEFFQTAVVSFNEKAVLRVFLNGKFKQFRAVVTLSPGVDKGSTAEYFVRKDNGTIIGPGEMPWPRSENITVDVSGAEYIDLCTRSSGKAPEFFVWGNALLIKEKKDWI